MITTFDIVRKNKKLTLDYDTVQRLLGYDLYTDLYDGDFKSAFAETYRKICAKYPLDNTAAQTFVEINLFFALTDFYKNLLTNQGLYINIDEPFQKEWNKIEEENNFIATLKEVYTDVSRFGNGLFKVICGDYGIQITSISPSCWFPVFNKGNINDCRGHIVINTLNDSVNGKDVTLKFIEKHHRGYIENELWLYRQGNYTETLNVEAELGIPSVDDYSELWDDFLIFPVKNTAKSDSYYGTSDYESCKSVAEELMLTVSQNSKILNRHANPKITGSNENLQYNPVTGKSEFPNKDFIPVGRDGIKAEYITADLQENAVNRHIENLLKFFHILTKTPPQAFGLDMSGNLSGESLRKIFMASLTKIDDIKQVSFNPALKKLVKCATALNHTPVSEVKIDWGSPIPEDRAEQIENSSKRIASGIQSRLDAIAELDNLSIVDAKIEFEKILAENKAYEGSVAGLGSSVVSNEV